MTNNSGATQRDERATVPARRFRGQVRIAVVLACCTAAAAQGQDGNKSGVHSPFGAGMPDMPAAMPEMPGMPAMPAMPAMPGMPEDAGMPRGGMPELGPSPEPAGLRDQPPVRHESSLDEKRRVLRSELDKLSPDDQQQLRRALRQVWSDRKVAEARLAYREAGKNYQRALFSAMLEEDEALRPFLERLVQAGLDLAYTPIVEAHVRVAELFEVPQSRFEPYKDVLRTAYANATTAPKVLEIRAELESARPERRTELNLKLQEALRSELLKELPAINDWISSTSEMSA